MKVKSHIVKVYGNEIDISTKTGQLSYQLLRRCEIISDSQELINTSDNLETVLSRIPILENALLYLTECSDDLLKMYRLKTHDQMIIQYNNWMSKKPFVINSAISRSCKKAVEYAKTLKTANGKINHMRRYFEKSLSLPGLLPENIEILLQLKRNLDSDN